jgi:deoxyhypusine synthase
MENLKKNLLFKEGILDVNSKKTDETYGFQGENLAKATEILTHCIKNNYRIDLGFTSNAITSGIRKLITMLCKKKLIDNIVTTAGGIEEDIIKCIEGEFELISEFEPDYDYYERGVFRSGNLLAPGRGYVKLESLIETKLKNYKKKIITTSDLIKRLSKDIGGKSYLYWANKKKIPVYCPCIEDGAIGDHIYLKSFKKKLNITYTPDHINYNNSLVTDDRKKLALILGGSIPKHYILNSAILAGGFDSLIYLNTGLEYDGSNGGAEPKEAISWGKLKKESQSVKVFGDFTITFPYLLSLSKLL